MTTPLSLHWGDTKEPHKGLFEGQAAEAAEAAEGRGVRGFTVEDALGVQRRQHMPPPARGGSPKPGPPAHPTVNSMGHSPGSAASPGVPLGKPVCHMSKEELASLLLCSADAPQVLDALQRLSPSQLRPECFHSSRVSCAGVEGLEPVRLCCEREDARCRQRGGMTAGRGGDTPANTLLGSFVVEVVGASDCRCSEERCRCQRVKRTVCDCRGACKCGRWQLQSMQAVPNPSQPGGLLPLGLHQVVRETLRWVEYCDERTVFVPGNYKMYSYYIDEKQAEPGTAPALTGPLQSWVEGFVWRRRQGRGQKPSRLTLCQAFFDPPRKGVRRAVEPKRPRGTKRGSVGLQTGEAPRPGGKEGREKVQQGGQADVGVGGGQKTMEGTPGKTGNSQGPDEVPFPPLKRLHVGEGGLDLNLNLSLGHQVDPPSPSPFSFQTPAKGGRGSESALRETGGGSRSLRMEGPPSPRAFSAQIAAKVQVGWGSEALREAGNGNGKGSGSGSGSRSPRMEDPALGQPPAANEATQPSASPERGGREPPNGTSLGLTCGEPSGVHSEPGTGGVEDCTQHLGLLAEVSQQLAGAAWAEGEKPESGDGVAPCEGQNPSTSALGAGPEGVGEERVGDEGTGEERERSEEVGDRGLSAKGEEMVDGEGLGAAFLGSNAIRVRASPLPGLARTGPRAPRLLPPFISPRQDLTNVLAAWALKAEKRQDTRPADMGGANVGPASAGSMGPASAGSMGVGSAEVGDVGVRDRGVGDAGEGNVGTGGVGDAGIRVGSVSPSGVGPASCDSSAIKTGVQSPTSLDLLVARPVPAQAGEPAEGTGTPVGAPLSSPITGCTEGPTELWVAPSAPMTASAPATASASAPASAPVIVSGLLPTSAPTTTSAPERGAPARLDEERWRRLMADAASEIAKLDEDCGGREARRLLGLLNQVTLLSSKAAAFQVRGGGEGGGGGGGGGGQGGEGGACPTDVLGEASTAPCSEVPPAAAVQPCLDQPQGSENQVGPEGAVPCGLETPPPSAASVECEDPLPPPGGKTPHPAPNQAEETHYQHCRDSRPNSESVGPRLNSAPAGPSTAEGEATVPGSPLAPMRLQHASSQAAKRHADSGAEGAPIWDRPLDSPTARSGRLEDTPGGGSEEKQDLEPRPQPALGGPPDVVPTKEEMPSLVRENLHGMLRKARSQKCPPSPLDEAKGAPDPPPDGVKEKHRQQGAPLPLPPPAGKGDAGGPVSDKGSLPLPAGKGDAVGPVSDKGLADLVYSPHSPLLGATPIAADPEGIARYAGSAGRAADAARAGAPGFHARKGEQFLGCFLAVQQEKNEGKGDVQRKVCACAGSCEHGRWQRQGRISDIACATSDGCEARFRKEMVRWHEWDARRARIFPEKPFVPTGYMMYTYSIEESVGGAAPLLGAPGNEKLLAWVEKFQWSNNNINNSNSIDNNNNSSTNNNSTNNSNIETGKGGPRTRIVICQAFLSDPEKRKAAAFFEERRARRQRAGDGQGDSNHGRLAPASAAGEGAGHCRPLSEDAASSAAVAGDGLKASALTLSIGPHTEAWKRPRRIMTRPSLQASFAE